MVVDCHHVACMCVCVILKKSFLEDWDFFQNWEKIHLPNFIGYGAEFRPLTKQKKNPWCYIMTINHKT